MKKTFPLQVEGKHPDRLLDATKHEIRKYLRRERRRTPPEGFDLWDFDCRFGTSLEDAAVVELASVMDRIDAVVAAGGSQFYLEILAKPMLRKPRPVVPAEPGAES